MSLWIKGQAQLSQRDYTSAVSTLSSLDNQSYLRDNTQLLNSLAESKFCDGQYTQALALFQRVIKLCNLPSLLVSGISSVLNAVVD